MGDAKGGKKGKGGAKRNKLVNAGEVQDLDKAKNEKLQELEK